MQALGLLGCPKKLKSTVSKTEGVKQQKLTIVLLKNSYMGVVTERGKYW